MANDDYRDRMAAIDPATRRAGVGATVSPGQGGHQRRAALNTPDGFDLLLPNGSTPTHLATG